MARAKSRRGLWAAGASALLVVGGGALALGPAAPGLVDFLLDGQRAWRLGRLQVDGVTGEWLGSLRAARLAIADDDGVWFEARNVELDWRPFDLLFGDVDLQTAAAEDARILRMPRLLDEQPSAHVAFDTHIGAASIGTLALAPEALGQAATFTAAFSMMRTHERFDALALQLRRTDSDADHAVVTYRAGDDFTLSADIAGAAGGILARALGVEDKTVAATASGDGSADTGEARYHASIGAGALLSGEGSWSHGRWRHQAQADLRLLPMFEELGRRIGPTVRANAEGQSPDRFVAHAETPFLQVDLDGRTDPRENGAFSAQLVATSARISDIAREAPFELGAARMTGEVRRANGALAFRGVVESANGAAFDQSVDFVGPISASLTDRRFALSADLRASGSPDPLFVDSRLVTELAYDRAAGRFSLTRAELSGQAVAVDATGWVRDGAGEFTGEWRSLRLGTIIPGLDGAASGRWRAFTEASTAGHTWVTSVDGRGDHVSGRDSLLAQALGATPQLDGRFRNERGGITVSHARIDGAKLRAGGTGRIVRGIADIALELSAQGPVNIGDAQILGASDATGRLTGRIVRPTVTVSAHLSSFAAAGVTVVNPTVDFVLAPSPHDYAGTATVDGVASGQRLTGSANVSLNDDGLSLAGLDAQWGALSAQGAASFAKGGATATLDFNGAFDRLLAGATGRVAGALALTPSALVLDAQFADAHAGEMQIRAATLHAEGPLHAIAARYSVRGRLRQAPLALAGTATADATDGLMIHADGRGALAGADVFTRAPIEARFGGHTLDASINVAVGDGAVVAAWREDRTAVTAAARMEDAPLAPLAAIFGERAVGRIDGSVSLHNSGRGLSGEVDVTLDDARFAGRQRAALDMRINGELSPSRLQAVVDATSEDGLVAHFEADAPVETSSAPLRIALIPDRQGEGRWSVHGPAESLWAAARLQDQSLSGSLDGAGQISFGAGRLSGTGHVEIVNGRFEDKLTGVTLVDLNARVALSPDGVNIENFSAAGARGGRLTARGGSTSANQGRIVVDVDDVRIANRPDAHARASGELALEWRGLDSKLSGALSILEADLDIAASPTAGIPTLDVMEVNRPSGDDEEEATQAQPRAGSTDIDVRITAPGRVYTRGRGVNAEWALDLRLDGTAAAPDLYGEARAVRGTLALSGQPFEIDNAVIRFVGDPMDAQIDLTATRDTADLSARVRLTGTARDPEIAFSSDPPLPEDEILPQVLFGRSVQDLSPFEAAQLAASLAALSGRASLDLLDAARSATGLDRLNVRQDQAGGFLVAGGVYLTRDVYLELARTGLGETETRVEWTVRPRLVLITSFLGDRDQRVSLRWRRESD